MIYNRMNLPVPVLANTKPTNVNASGLIECGEARESTDTKLKRPVEQVASGTRGGQNFQNNLPVLDNPAKPIASGGVLGGDVVTRGGQNTLSGGEANAHVVETASAHLDASPPAQNYFDRIKSDPKRKHDYYPDQGELRDAWINENPPFYGEEQDTESYD